MSINGPRQTVIISSRGNVKVMGKEKEVDNLSTTDSHMISSHNPTIFSVSIKKNRATHEIISNSGVFCVNFLGHEMEELAKNCSKTDGRMEDKFKKYNVVKGECSTIDCPHIKEAHAHLECSVENVHEMGDHIIFHGKVMSGKKNNNGKRLINVGNITGQHKFKGI